MGGRCDHTSVAGHRRRSKVAKRARGQKGRNGGGVRGSAKSGGAPSENEKTQSVNMGAKDVETRAKEG